MRTINMHHISALTNVTIPFKNQINLLLSDSFSSYLKPNATNIWHTTWEPFWKIVKYN